VKVIIKFLNDWTQVFGGDLVQGGELTVDYDLGRLAAYRSTFRGAALWDSNEIERIEKKTKKGETVYETVVNTASAAASMQYVAPERSTYENVRKCK
jgi:hypothetical protein